MLTLQSGKKGKKGGKGKDGEADPKKVEILKRWSEGYKKRLLKYAFASYMYHTQRMPCHARTVCWVAIAVPDL